MAYALTIAAVAAAVLAACWAEDPATPQPHRHQTRAGVSPHKASARPACPDDFPSAQANQPGTDSEVRLLASVPAQPGRSPRLGLAESGRPGPTDRGPADSGEGTAGPHRTRRYEDPR